MGKPNYGDGGPAFPLAATPKDIQNLGYDGMSLRDWLAAKALPVVAPAHNDFGCEFMSSFNYESCAKDAYRLADAMLAARASDLKGRK